MRLVIATCAMDCRGRLTAHLPMATRLLMVKGDRSVSIHADGGAYKPLNWMNPPCELFAEPSQWLVVNPRGETLTITIEVVHADYYANLGTDPGLEKDGVEARLQEMLAARPEVRLAQQGKPQARVLAAARGIAWIEVDYDRLRGASAGDLTPF